MDLLDMNLFKIGLFKQAKFLITSPSKSQRVIHISEDGSVGVDYLPLRTGFVEAVGVKKSWKMVNELKLELLKDGLPNEQSALFICDRSYLPLDPNNVIKLRDRQAMLSLKEIARLSHTEAKSDVRSGYNLHHRMHSQIIQWSFLLLMFLGFMWFMRGC